VKHWGSLWLTAVLLGPVLLVLGILIVVGSQPRGASAQATGRVDIEFTATAITSDGKAISQEFQQVLLNAVAVRLNPSGDLTISETDSSWVAIRAPISAASNLSGSPASVHVAQLDLLTLQNIPFFFRAATIQAQSYRQVELVLNSTNPGYVVPLCEAGSNGCIPYRIALTPNPVTQLRANFTQASKKVGYNLPANAVQPLVIHLNVVVGPTGNSGTVQITARVVPQLNSVVSGAPYNPALGRVTGKVKNFASNTVVHAELSGTDQLVAKTTVKSNGTFVLNLPAVACPVSASGSCLPATSKNSTLYDFYVTGDSPYLVRSQVPVLSQGGATTQPITNLGTLTLKSSTVGSLSGKIFDACGGTKVRIPGATVEILVPDTTVPGTRNQICTANKDCNCDLDKTLTPPAVPSNCVVVTSTTSTDLGFYPLTSTELMAVPFKRPEDVDHYDVEISNPGFNTTVQEMEVKSGAFICPGSGFKHKGCNFGLTHGYLSGSTTVSGSNAGLNSLDVLVMAEDSGTDNLENLTRSVIPVNASNGSFSMPVPIAPPSPSLLSSPVASSSHSPTPTPSPTVTPGIIYVPHYDVFAAVQDLSGSNPASNSGHSIEAEAGVGGPAACATVTPTVELLPAECVGLGSVTGTVSGASPSTTSVRMSKTAPVYQHPGEVADVQIMETEPNSIMRTSPNSLPNANNYSFCAPFDSYELSHYENETEVSSVDITLEAPIVVPSPCPSVCAGTATTCLQCLPLLGVDLP
jgi:hypothetical protein